MLLNRTFIIPKVRISESPPQGVYILWHMRIWQASASAALKVASHQSFLSIAQCKFHQSHIQMACFVDHNWWRPRDGRSNWAGSRASDFPLPYGCPADFIWEPHYLTGPARCDAGQSCLTLPVQSSACLKLHSC